ncbi:MAG: hypothetical protein H0T51_26880 [Pirellulales bacterium]|nr:hypothetical protein [Pirellulales bacterium]
MNAKKSEVAILFFGVAYLTLTTASGDTVTFNSPGELASKFNLNGTAGYYVEQPTGGVNNTGSVLPNQAPGNASAIFNAGTFDVTGSDTVTVSAMVKWQAPTSTLNNALAVGIIGDETHEFLTTNQPSINVSVIAQSTGGPQQFASLRAINQTAGQATSGINAGTMILTVGNWYKLTATFQNSGAFNTFNITGSLQDWGTTGAALETTLGTGTPTSPSIFQNASLAADTALFAGFRTESTAGAQTVDMFATLPNFPVVAEPDADFDGDDDVDGEDFLIWQRGVGVGTTQEAGDANESSMVDGDDLSVWRAQFTGTLLIAAAVPECSGKLLAICGGFGLISLRHCQPSATPPVPLRRKKKS